MFTRQSGVLRDRFFRPISRNDFSAYTHREGLDWYCASVPSPIDPSEKSDFQPQDGPYKTNKSGRATDTPILQC